jgi:hypothetical protein
VKLFKEAGMITTTQYGLRNAAILDSGATIHIFNEIARFRNYRAAEPGDVIIIGQGHVPVLGYGDVQVQVTRWDNGSSILRLRDVAHCADFATNVVSLDRLNDEGICWDNRADWQCLRREFDGSVICRITKHLGQFVLEYLPPSLDRAALHARHAAFDSWAARPPSQVDGDTWHHRLGHPGSEALQQSVHASTGMKIHGPTMVECDECAKAKITKQIRRTPRNKANEADPGRRIGIDFHGFDTGINKMNHLMLLTDRSSGFMWDYYLPDRLTETIQACLLDFFKILKRQNHTKPAVIECDNEVKKTLSKFLRSKGVKAEPSAPHTPSQNGLAERSARYIKDKILAMRTSAKLPASLWPEIAHSAVYLANRTARYQPTLGEEGGPAIWKSPYEVYHTFLAHQQGKVITARLPELAHLRVYGCKAYAMTAAQQEGRRKKKEFEPKAWVGYLVGYDTVGIYRVWNPRSGLVIRTRDVVFNEKERFDGKLEALERDDLRTLTTEEISRQLELQYTRLTQHTSPITYLDEDLVEAPTNSDDQENSGFSGGDQGNLQENEAIRTRGQANDEPEEEVILDVIHAAGLPLNEENGSDDSSESTDLTSVSDFSEISGFDQSDDTDDPDANPIEKGLSHFQPPDPDQAPAVFLTQHQLPHRPAPWKTAFLAGTCAEVIGTLDGSPINKAQRNRLIRKLPSEKRFLLDEDDHEAPGDPMEIDQTGEEEACQKKTPGTAVSSQEEVARLVRTGDIFRVHRSRLPPPPKWHSELNGEAEPRPWHRRKPGKTHPFGKLFEEAEEEHLKSHKEMRSWIEVASSEAKGHQVLDCMWVYVYKLNKHGFFRKCKARLVVRGDQQPTDGQADTYAATLAGRSFRALIAIATRFDLEMKQYDAVNAFVNASIDEVIYMRMPPGRRGAGDKILLLKKALYGLRKSPLLWQRHLTASLKGLSFNPVPQEPCVLINNGIIVFFYVDDIIVAYRRRQEGEAQCLITGFQERYKLSGGDDIQWFLGIEVLRDRKARSTWLSQSSYIDKIASLVDSEGKITKTPMSDVELMPYEGKATRQSIKKYQRKVGSLLYAAVITRPDVAFAVSRLARFNINPGPQHHDAADRVLRYLKTFRGLALQYGGDDEFVVASDSSFADNTQDRKSSQGFAMKLFGGLIAWRASKQDTVTTSTTEAELLALSQAVKEAIFTRRLLTSLKVSLDEDITRIMCDNQQTIRLVNAEVAKLQTKLKHVDIHNHWLRQEVEKGVITIEYVKSEDMIADGLTKALQTGKFEVFRDQVGLVDISERLMERRFKELQEDDLETLLLGPR